MTVLDGFNVSIGVDSVVINHHNLYCKSLICRSLPWDMRDDLRNRDLASVDMSKLYPFTIYGLTECFFPGVGVS